MAIPASRAEFKDYCLRKLGAPVISINVSDDQIEDRIDEALSYWRDYHYDGSELVYMAHQLTAQEVQDKAITLPNHVIGVVRIFEMSSVLLGTGDWSAAYQYVLNNISAMTTGGMSDYYVMRQNLAMVEEVLVGKPAIRYNRHGNVLHIDLAQSKLVEGRYIIVECYAAMDPSTVSEIWSDRWLQNYATVLIQENWGNNLTKFTNMQLVGGVQFNGMAILESARKEREKMESEVLKGFSQPVRNFYG